VKGSVHAAIGASTPAALVLTQHVTLIQGAVMASVSAGFALLPDIDHPKSCASTALGGIVHKAVRSGCKAVVRSTSTRRDNGSRRSMQRRHPMSDVYHRTLTHTLAVALGLGAVSYIASWLNAMAAGVVAAFGVYLLWPLRRITFGLVAVGAVAAAAGAVFMLTPWLLALAVTCGYTSHVVADACTRSGVPAFWPIPIKGKRWWNIRLLDNMVASGSALERAPALGVSLFANAVLLFINF
jgi:membrane-bound metal-dependent hydrolase YbcI (DUF457 family)